MARSSASVRGTAAAILDQVRRRGAYADELLDNSLRHNHWKPEDRALLIELVNGTLRWRGQLDWILAGLFRGNYESSSSLLRSILEVGLYQIRFLTKVPGYAAVSETVGLAKKSGGPAWGRLVNAVLRRYIRDEKALQWPSPRKPAAELIAVQFSHPEWIVNRWLKRFGCGKTIAFCEFNNRRPVLSLRVNPARARADRVRDQLASAGVQTEPSRYFKDFLRVSGSLDVARNQAFLEGRFTVQDESTAIPSILLNPQAGERVLDMCAAPGGKACHLAHLAEDSATVVAVDIRMDRLHRLRQNVQRLRLGSIKPVLADATCLPTGAFDKILLDAPCSGLGVLGRRADLRWRKQSEDIAAIKKVQRKLLQQAAKLLKNDGAIVYSTCSLEKEETEDIVAEFIEANEDFRVDTRRQDLPELFQTPEGYWRTLPFEHETDGTFAVRLVRRMS